MSTRLLQLTGRWQMAARRDDMISITLRQVLLLLLLLLMKVMIVPVAVTYHHTLLLVRFSFTKYTQLSIASLTSL